MKRRCYTAAVVAVAALAVFPALAGAQAADTARDPDAMAALEKMGAYLRTLPAFQVHAAITTEEVLVDGEKVQFASVADLVARKPDRLRIEVNGDRKQRRFLYDGTSFTLWAPRVKYYATVPAPPTIGELVNVLEDRFDIDVPFVDLFRWGTPESNAGDITSATDIGPGVIDGVTCQHYAFRQKGLDWQIWIQTGDYPLPRKLVLTTLTDDARPQHTSLYTWNLAPSFDETAFAFVPPADAKRITFAEAAATVVARKNKK